MVLKTLTVAVILISGLMAVAHHQEDEKDRAETCRKDCMPICLFLRRKEQVTVESCESACELGCGQLHGLGRRPGRWDDSVY